MVKWKVINKSPNKDCRACGRCCWQFSPECAREHLTRNGVNYYCEFYNKDDFPQICTMLNKVDVTEETIEQWWAGCVDPTHGEADG